MVSQQKFGQATTDFHLILRWDPKPHFIDQILKNKHISFNELYTKQLVFILYLAITSHIHTYPSNSLGHLTKEKYKY